MMRFLLPKAGLMVIAGCLLSLACYAPVSQAGKLMVFSGGPAGGTFQIVANAVQV